jgi:pyruvate/2-oxoglutarate dehydrogenase complex dihydrolipoamide acyltransferase (E2) component
MSRNMRRLVTKGQFGVMTMGVVQIIKSAVGVGDSVGDIVGRIEAERAKRAAAMVEAERLEALRVGAESYEDAQAAESRLGRVHWEVSRIEALLPQLEARLVTARAAAQRAGIAKHLEIARKLFPELRQAIMDAAAVQQRVIDARTAATAELGEGVVTLHIPHVSFRGLLLTDLIQAWERDVARSFPAKSAPVPPVAAVVKPAQVAQVKPVAPKPAPPVAPVAPVKPKPRPLRRDKVAVGSKLVTVLRPGIELPGGERAMIGDVIGTFTMEQADALLRAGAVDLASNT